MNIIVDNLLTNYTRVGDGPKIVLFLHGWADTGKTFEQLAKQVIKDDSKYTAILIDLPGFGATQQPPKPWGLEDYARFVEQFLNKAELKPDVIVGHSNGGSIAIYALARNIVRSNKLVLIASAGIRSDSNQKKAMRAIAKPAKLVLKMAPKNTQKRIRQKLYSAIGSDYLVAEHMQESFKKVVSTDLTNDATNISVPTLIVYGDSDDATPLSYGQKYADIIPDSRLYTVETAGHFVHQEQVYLVATQINEFIK